MSRSTATERSLVVLKYFHFFLYGAIAILLSYFPLYFEATGLSKVQIGLLMAGGPFVSIFANPFWGYWSDRLQNVRLIIIVILIGNLLVTQIVFQLSEYVFIYAAMLVFFFFQSSLFSQSNSLILNAIEGTRYKFGAFRAWGSIGWALMAVTAGPVIAWLGITRLWIVYSVMLLLSMVFTIGLPRGKVSDKPLAATGGYRRALFANKIFFIFLLLGILIAVPNSMNQTFISLYIADLGGTEVLIGWSVFLSAIFEAPVFLLFDRFLKNNTTTMIGSLVLVSALFIVRWVLMAAATGPVHLVLIQMLHSLSFGGFFYIGTSLTAHLIPKELRATGQAVYAITWVGISGILAGVLGGWMYEQLGPRIMYSIGTVLSFIAMIGFGLMWQWLRKGRDRGRASEQIVG